MKQIIIVCVYSLYTTVNSIRIIFIFINKLQYIQYCIVSYLFIYLFIYLLLLFLWFNTLTKYKIPYSCCIVVAYTQKF